MQYVTLVLSLLTPSALLMLFETKKRPKYLPIHSFPFSSNKGD